MPSDHVERTVGEVDQPHHAEHERQPRRHQEQHDAELQVPLRICSRMSVVVIVEGASSLTLNRSVQGAWAPRPVKVRPASSGVPGTDCTGARPQPPVPQGSRDLSPRRVCNGDRHRRFRGPGRDGHATRAIAGPLHVTHGAGLRQPIRGDSMRLSRETGLPGACGFPPSYGALAIAFRSSETLGTRNAFTFEAAYPRPTCAAYASPNDGQAQVSSFPRRRESMAFGQPHSHSAPDAAA